MQLPRTLRSRTIDRGFGVYAYMQGYLYRAFTFLKIFLSLSLLLSLDLSAQDADTYIRNYKDIAIAEMIRTGIPASIKLAQGMIESNCGTSELARKANNHFGIKCGGDWTGKSFHKEDDDYINGQLTKSCFREFNSPYESFVAHSDFLTDPKKASRYGPLFQLKTTDYKAWARGLSTAGYATDPAYADKLIKVIEDNRLYDFDNGVEVLAAAKPAASLGTTMVRRMNDVDYVLAAEGDNLAILAARYDLSEKQLLRYNDHAFTANDRLSKGTRVYLENKKSKFHGKQKYYVLKPGEDLIFIAQQYGVKLSSLQRRNGIKGNQIPAPGQKIMLKGKRSTPLQTKDPYQLPEDTISPPVEESVEQPSTEQSQNSASSSPVSLASLHAPPAQPVDTASGPTNHLVKKGETLFSIAQNFGLSVEELKKMNNLSVDTLLVGQKLIIK
jgi:LysM repeat protein